MAMWTVSYEDLIETCDEKIEELERQLAKVKEDKAFFEERLKESSD